MPLKRYGVLKARPTSRCRSTHQHMHYHLLLEAGGLEYRASISVRSVLSPSEMEYRIEMDLRHPITRKLSRLAPGFHDLEPTPDGLALDYIRYNLVDPERFLTLPCTGPGCGEDLNEVLDGVVCEALDDPACQAYVFGEPWEAHGTDRVFRFFPSRGVHDVHMNQGNDPGHWGQDGIWQDGALLIEHPGQNRWIGVFLKFQSQSWHTDEETGHALSANFFHDGDGVPLDRHGFPRPDGLVRIVSVRVRPPAAPDGPHGPHGPHGPDGSSVVTRKKFHESVTLLNVCPQPVNITGWSLLNTRKRSWRLRGELAPGEAREIPLGASMPLGSRGGVITLLNRKGLKIHGVRFTEEQVCQQVPGGRLSF